MWKVYGCLSLSLLLLGCAGSAESMRAEPIWVFLLDPEGNEQKARQSSPTDIELTCHTEASRRGTFSAIWAFVAQTSSSARNKSCLYVNAELKAPLQYAVTDIRAGEGAGGNDKEQARKIIYTLLSISDYNCQNFLNRALALRSSAEFSAGLTSNLTSGLSAATAAGDPGVSSALSVSSILLNAGSDQFSKTYYLNKTFDIFGRAIETSRKEKREEILARLESATPTKLSSDLVSSEKKVPSVADRPYVFMQALADIQEYNELCSFRKGLEETAERVMKTAESK